MCDPELAFSADDCPPNCVVPYAPTLRSVTNLVIALCGIDCNDVVVDFGCGDGRVLIEAARQKGCRGIGYDIRREMVTASTEAAERDECCRNRLIFRYADLLQPHFECPTDATVAFMYLVPQVLRALRPKVARMFAQGRLRTCCTYLYPMAVWVPAVDPKTLPFPLFLYRFDSVR
jgi:SAM-dependent methyltransferase